MAARIRANYNSRAMRAIVPALAVVLVLSGGCAEIATDPYGVNREANADMNAGRTDQAVAKYTAAIQANPANPVFYQNRGIAYWRTQKYAEAYADFTEAARLKPGDMVALDSRTVKVEQARTWSANQAGHADCGQSHWPQAADWYTRAVEADPAFGTAYWNRGYARTQAVDEAGARQDLDRWLSFDGRYAPYRPEFDLLLFRPERAQRLAQEADEAFRAEAAGDFPEAHRRYARAYGLSNPGGNADDEGWCFVCIANLIRAARRLSPPPQVPEEARRALIQAQELVKDRKHAEAAEAYRKAFLICPWYADAYTNRGLLLGELGQYTDAVNALDFYAEFFPEAPDLREVKDKIYAWEAKGGKVYPFATYEWRVWAGINYEKGKEGVSILAVVPGGPADRSGLRVGDEILSAAGKPVSYEGFIQELRGRKPGDAVDCRVRRGAEDLPLRLQLGHRSTGK